MSSKYNNKKFVNKYGKWDSEREARRYEELLRMEDAGEICDIARQFTFNLIPAQKTSTGTLRKLDYIADFVYFTKDGEMIVEDVKPHNSRGEVPASYKMTNAWQTYMIKKKLMKYIHNIEIKEA